VWVATNLTALANHTYAVTTASCGPSLAREAAAPAPAPSPLVTVTRQGTLYVLSNRLVSVRVPAVEASSGVPPPPFAGISVAGAAGPWLGSSSWSLPPATPGYTAFTATVTASGPLWVEVVGNYTFAGGATWASWRVRLAPNQWGPQVRVAPCNVRQQRAHSPSRTPAPAQVWENHTVSIDAGVDVALHTTSTSAPTSGGAWSPTTALSNPWFYCNPAMPVDPNGSLNQSNAQLAYPLGPLGRLPNGVLAYLQPRWSQSCDSRWFFAATDGATAFGVLVARPSAWAWPQWHNQYWTSMRSHVMNAWSEAPGTAAIHSPLYGARFYYWLAGRAAAVAGQNESAALATLYTMQELDRLTNVYILDWPGTTPAVGGFAGQFFYDENTNPTGIVRHEGEALLANLNKGVVPAPGRPTLSAAQVWCDPDWYAAYQGDMAPENTNFASDFYQMCIGYSAAVSTHPNASVFKGIAVGVFTMDLYHSVGLASTSTPAARSGAGQESPGYTSHASGAWLAEWPVLQRYYGWDAMTADPRLPAAINFFYHASTPWAYHFLGPAAADNANMGGRWLLPLGDTHPNSLNYTQASGRKGGGGGGGRRLLPWPPPRPRGTTDADRQHVRHRVAGCDVVCERGISGLRRIPSQPRGHAVRDVCGCEDGAQPRAQPRRPVVAALRCVWRSHRHRHTG